jgi:hypothetical protein
MVGGVLKFQGRDIMVPWYFGLGSAYVGLLLTLPRHNIIDSDSDQDFPNECMDN